MDDYRKECDSIGCLDVPENAYYGVQTLRGRDNFNITGNKADITFIHNIVKIKIACAITNYKAGIMAEDVKNAIVSSCYDILSGKYDAEFITDGVQGGAGTTFNMNVNEVIANVATEKLGGKKGEYLCNPNDHVNMSQSTNDVIPTAIKLTVIELHNKLSVGIDSLLKALLEKSEEFDSVIKMGRTQLEDAVPIRLGQEFKAYYHGIKRCAENLKAAVEEMKVVNIGGTAIGTSINANKKYLNTITEELSETVGYKVFKAEDLIDSTQNLDGFVKVSGALKSLAVTLSKMCNDLRLMASGPKTGFEEIILPAKQNGSSIMPGKVNPVIPEVVSQVAFLIVGNDVTVTMAAEAGQLELNAFEPVISYKLFESLKCLDGAVKTLNDNCVSGISANTEHCSELLYQSVGVVTALSPILGYKKCAELAKEALRRNISIKDLVLEYNLLDKDTLTELLNPIKLTEPQ